MVDFTKRKKTVGKKVTPAKKAAPKSEPAIVDVDDPVRWSDDPDEELRRFIVCIHGAMASGKTFLAASADPSFPSKLPAAKMVSLDKTLWIAADQDATAGFAHNKLRVRSISIPNLMGIEKLWRAAGFSRPPSVMEASKYALDTAQELALDGIIENVVVDTVTTWDLHLISYHEVKYAAHPNQYEAFKHNRAAHALIHTKLVASGANIIYLFHTRAVGDDTKNEKSKNVSVLVAGGAKFVPDVTGQAPKFYKHDATLQLVMKATRAPGKKTLSRKVLTSVNDEGMECKNRFEGVLDHEEEPNLRRIFGKIRAAQA
jgi:hypothetical protein